MFLSSLLKPLKFDYINDDITNAHFPDTGRHAACQLVHFDEYLSTNEVLKRLDAKGLQPATIYEMTLWIGNWNGTDYVVVLGQEWNGYVVCVYGRGGYRGLRLDRVGGGWDRGCTFLAVRKLKSSDTQNLSPSDPVTLESLGEQIKRLEGLVMKALLKNKKK